MKRFLSLFIIILILISSIVVFADMDDSHEPPMDLQDKTSEIIVRFKEDTSQKSQKTFSKGYSVNNTDAYQLNSNTRVISVGDRDVDQLIEEIKLDPSVEYAEKNYQYKLFDRPNDPYYENLWHLDKIYAEDAWKEADFAQEIVVAVIDSGIDRNHRDLKNRIARGGYNFLNNNSLFDDYDGHGTFVSGLIAAEANNNYGIAGVVGRANIKILPLKVTNSEGIADNDDIIRAIDYSIEKKVDVINMSLGGPDYSYFFDEACQRAIDANIVVVAAVGNEGEDNEKKNQINYPAAYDRVIGVGSTDWFDDRANFSNANKSVDIVAPGDGVYSTWTYYDLRERGFKYGYGTSYSTPMVAATAALMRGINKGISVRDISNILTTTAKDLGPKGKDIYFGYGLLNMKKAIQEVSIRQSSNEFVGFNILDVEKDKVLRIDFNNPVSLSSLGLGLYGSTDTRGVKNDIGISIELDEKNPRTVYIKPRDQWPEGYSFVFIGDNVKDIRGRRHRSKVRIVIRTLEQ